MILQYIFAIGTLILCLAFGWLALCDFRQWRAEQRAKRNRSMMNQPRIIIGTKRRGKPKRK